MTDKEYRERVREIGNSDFVQNLRHKFRNLGYDLTQCYRWGGDIKEDAVVLYLDAQSEDYPSIRVKDKEGLKFEITVVVNDSLYTDDDITNYISYLEDALLVKQIIENTDWTQCPSVY